MTKSLADFNYHVIPGDILLLAGTDKDRIVIRAYQAAARHVFVPFTHVAIVISNTLIADAMPKLGVRIRSWAPEEVGYFLDRCVVARHAELAARALTNPGEVMKRVQYYIDQPWALTAIGKAEIADRAGVVCSQFVALALKDLGAPLAASPPMELLPVDVDLATRKKDGWRQFPFLEYGLCSRASRPNPDSGYRAVLEGNLRLDLSSEDLAKAAALAQDVVDGVGRGDPSAVDMFLKEMDAVVGRARELQHEMDTAVQRHVLDMQDAARTAVTLDKASLEFHDWLTRHETDPSFQAALVRIAKDEHIDAVAELGGARLLDQWRQLYVDHSETQPQFLVERDAPERQRRHRELFGKQITALVDSAKRLNARAEEISAAFIAAMEERPIEATLFQTLSQLCVATTQLQSVARWLAGESRDRIETRVQGYLALAENELRTWRDKADPNDYQLATSQLLLLFDLDRERLLWTIASTKVDALKNVVERLLTSEQK